MWRNCAHKVRGLSQLTAATRRELSSLRGAASHAECCRESHSDERITLRSFSSGREPSETQGRSSDGLSRQPPSRPNEDMTRRESEGRSALKPIKKTPSQKTVTLDEASKYIAVLNQRLSELDELPPVWSTASAASDSVNQREAIFEGARALLGRIENTVKKQHVNPSGKHGPELSRLVGQILEIYSKTAVPFEDGTSVFDACCSAMTLLQDWNLDVQQGHFASAVEAAARESRWSEASFMFWEQIDGVTPMQVSEYLSIGLYAIARNSQIEGGATVDHVMDAALRMSMVCPTDQDHYVLAAGLALGHAGEGEAYASYLANSYNSSRLGQPLTAAVMNACILSSHADKALELFYDLNSDPLRGDSEWQYGGQYNSMNPLCRDVAMRALGEASGENLSDLALELYRQTKADEHQISMDAMHGVMKACERDGRWKEAVELMTEFLDGCGTPGLFVGGDETMSIVPVEEARESGNVLPTDIVLQRARHQIGSMLASMIRSCNSAEKFGMSLLFCYLVGVSLRSPGAVDNPTTNQTLSAFSNMMLSSFESHDELVTAAMASLCGLDCYDDAMTLYSDALDAFPSHAWYDARGCSEFVRESLKLSDAMFPSPWQTAQRYVHLLTSVCAVVEASTEDLDNDQMKSLSVALGNAMRCCNAAGQPEVSLLLSKRANNALASRDDTISTPFSLGSAVASFLGFQDSTTTEESQMDADPLLTDTTVLAETVNAYRAMGRSEEGLALLDLIPESFGTDSARARDDARWVPVVNQLILLLSDQHRIDDAHTLFKLTNESLRDSETLIAMATAFEKGNQWHEIIRLYKDAESTCLLSEQLGVIAMKAVVETSGKELPKQLRLIAKRLSELAGIRENQWLASRYWALERYLGWNPARLLMWWGDASTAYEKKLRFAIEQVEFRQKAGLKPKNDALRFIVDSVRQYKGPTESMPLNKEQWLELLLAVLAETENSTLCNSPKFVENACMSLFWLGAHKECLEYAQNAMARGVRITRATAEELADIAREKGLEIGHELALLSSRIS